MSDNTTPAPESAETPAPIEETPGESTEATPPAEEPTAEPTTVDALPEWAQKMIRDLREEAGGYRQKAKTAADEVSAQAATERDELVAKVTAAEERAAAAEASMARTNAALSAGFRADQVAEVAQLIKGDTPEEMATHATHLRELFGGAGERKSDPSQGMTGEVDNTAPGLARLRAAYAR